MGILDDAIKEHLELKRQHGVAEDELKQLEDEAFGAAQRPGAEETSPDAAAEAPTEFLAQPELEGEEDAPRSRRPDVADLQEAPPRSEPEAAEPEAEPTPEPEPPVEEEAQAMEHEAISESEIAGGPTTDEREAIAEQPTEMFDVEAEMAGTQAKQAPAEDEEPEPAKEDEYEEDDDFWDEKRLSDELDQALEAPSEVEEEALYEDTATEAEEPEPEEAQPEEADPDQAEHLTPAGDEEDVLEETPDFLEEAPEDDQLWFEQKPPKDFDFDD
jgi:hypothetical protein